MGLNISREYSRSSKSRPQTGNWDWKEKEERTVIMLEMAKSNSVKG